MEKKTQSDPQNLNLVLIHIAVSISKVDGNRSFIHFKNIFIFIFLLIFENHLEIN